MLRIINNLKFYISDASGRRFFIVALIFHLCAVYFSVGFLHPDEHFQILEPLNFKYGEIGPEVFGWDFKLHIRSWAQILIYYVWLWPIKMLGASPFAQAFWLRLFSSVLGLLTLAVLGKKLFEREARDKQVLWFWVLATLWFLPFFHARTSSENLSSSFMYLSMSLLYVENGTRRRWFVSGLLSGLSFLIRYQMGIVAFSLFIWALFIKKARNRQLIVFCLGVLLLLPIGILIDYWGQGVWTFAPWNYLNQNLIHNKAAQFGVSPWYYYFTKGIIKGIPPLSLLMLVGLILFLKQRKSHMLTFAVVPFTLVHMLIGHKEVRFLFFVYTLVPIMTIFVLPKLDKKWMANSLKGLLIINLGALLIMTFKPAHSPTNFYSYLWHKYTTPTVLYVEKESDGKSLSLDLKFYKRTHLSVQVSEYLDSTKGLLLTSRFGQFMRTKARSKCTLLHSNYPEWIINRNYDWFNWLSRSSIWALWECR